MKRVVRQQRAEQARRRSKSAWLPASSGSSANLLGDRRLRGRQNHRTGFLRSARPASSSVEISLGQLEARFETGVALLGGFDPFRQRGSRPRGPSSRTRRRSVSATCRPCAVPGSGCGRISGTSAALRPACWPVAWPAPKSSKASVMSIAASPRRSRDHLAYVGDAPSWISIVIGCCGASCRSSSQERNNAGVSSSLGCVLRTDAAGRGSLRAFPDGDPSQDAAEFVCSAAMRGGTEHVRGSLQPDETTAGQAPRRPAADRSQAG